MAEIDDTETQEAGQPEQASIEEIDAVLPSDPREPEGPAAMTDAHLIALLKKRGYAVFPNDRVAIIEKQVKSMGAGGLKPETKRTLAVEIGIEMIDAMVFQVGPLQTVGAQGFYRMVTAGALVVLPRPQMARQAMIQPTQQGGPSDAPQARP